MERPTAHSASHLRASTSGALADAFAPRLWPWAFVPALVFTAIYIGALRRRAGRTPEDRERR